MVLTINAQPLPKLPMPDYAALSISTLHFSHVPTLNSYRYIGTLAKEKTEISLYITYGESGDKRELEYGTQYRRHTSGYGINSFSYGMDVSLLKYEAQGEFVSSSASVFQIGPRVAYTWYLNNFFLRPQIGIDAWLGIFGSVTEREYSSYLGRKTNALPIIALMPDFQLEVGWSFKIVT